MDPWWDESSGEEKIEEGCERHMSDFDEGEEDEDDAVGLPGQALEDTEGYFQNQAGKRIEGLLQFRVRNVDTSKSMDRETGFVSIEGTMLSEDEEMQLQEQETIRRPEIGREQLTGQNEPSNAMTGAIMNGFDGAMDVDEMQGSKHRVRY